MKGNTLLGVVLGLLLVPSAAAAGSCPPSETIFPATTRAWLSIANPKALRAAFDRTEYGQMVKDPVMKPFVESFRDQLKSAGKQRLGKLGLTLEDLEKIPGGELAMAAIEPTPGMLASLLLVDPTGNEAETKALVARIEQRLLEQKATKVADEAATAAGITTFKLPPEPNAT
ncbi:MAG: hypothetical protein ACKOHG_18270, partial [Planctomycetia bacterium]